MAFPLGRNSGRLTAVRALHAVKGRREQGRFAFEGETLLREAVSSGFPVEEIYATRETYESVPVVRELETSGVPVFLIAGESAAKLSTLTSGAGLVSVAAVGLRAPEAVIGPASFTLVLADLNDPANAGTLLRSADAFGCDGVVCGDAGVDPFHPKVVRGSMGAIFRLPVALADPQSLQRAARAAGMRLVGLSTEGDDMDRQEWGRPVGLVVGNERHGLGRWAACCDGLLSIPMRKGVDSLSAGVAGSIALFCAVGNELRAKVKTTGAKSRMVY
ncbi:MAG: RNA methyltransferase [Candidatus Eremiobacteraeota bacterium]|nr:RNA methyltransferase [Candidatus Eremiobacteraeota bacterium]MBV9263563.1 RNA methyltransferase [Candidatus Eremiobacteraeota bacterium]